MKTVSSLKTNNKNIDSPKTPGGISKSLLTPCRRVGLSRNWKKSGPSPFVSPLSGSSELRSESIETPTRKRKQRNNEQAKQEIIEENSRHSSEEEPVTTAVCSKSETTPSKHISPLKKKPKTLLTTKIEESNKEVQTLSSIRHNETVSDKVIEDKVNAENNVTCNNIDDNKVVTTPVRVKSKSRSKKLNVNAPIESMFKHEETKENVDYPQEETSNNSQFKAGKQKSPNNLRKECIVVIQKKIFKKDLLKIKDYAKIKNKDINPVSQVLFDSDTDDVPLSAINKTGSVTKPVQTIQKNNTTIINLDDDDDDFTDNPKIKVKKLEDKTTSTRGLSSENSVRKKSKKSNDVKQEKTVCIVSIPTTSQSSFDDDDDFVQEKRTILIKKSYDKVIKPLKAKSTGSITQKDIDDLKARIEMKKKLLLAKTMTTDTEELRGLIKKWQRGCQDALIELTQLMRDKFPDKRNMDFSEILNTLKIPAALVGYDEDNDCFGTPTDDNIVLSKFNDI